MVDRSARTRLASVIATIALAVIGGASVPLAAARISPTSLLDQYARHKFDVVASVATLKPSDRVTFVEDFEQKGAKWVTAVGPTAASSRRLIAATAALDIARVWGAPEGWGSGRQLVMWGDQLLREDPEPQAAERLWDLAAIALTEGAEEPALLRGAAGLIAHAEARFPSEPRFRLAAAVLDESDTWYVGHMAAQHLAGGNVLPAEITEAYVSRLLKPGDASTGGSVPVSAEAANEITRVRLLGALVKTLETLAKVEPIAAEVHLRYGAVAMRLADRDVALQHFQAVEHATHDRELVYLARLFSGVVYERQNRLDDATAAYRSALQIVPHAQSASALLTALLVRSGHVAEASAEADGFLSAEVPADPWRTYRNGDYRLLPSEILQLQAALR